jgi:hypothetical protein
MAAGADSSRASDEASIVLDLHHAPCLTLKDSAADMETAAAAHAQSKETASNLKAVEATNTFAGQAGYEDASKHSNSSPQQLSSIYQVFSRRRRGLILGVVSISQFLNPFSSSIILPSLKVSRACRHDTITKGLCDLVCNKAYTWVSMTSARQLCKFFSNCLEAW